MNRGQAAEHAKRLRADMRRQRSKIINNEPDLVELDTLVIDCRALCGIAESLAENEVDGKNRKLFRDVADRALQLADLYAQLGRTFEELGGVAPSPRQRRLYDEVE